MKRKVLFLLFFVSFFQSSFSQNQTNFWYFGALAGLDFSSGSPVVLTNGALNTSEGVASISDSVGNLLFYTEGINVYNKNNVQMPNGFGLLGDVSTTQVIIVPDPGNPNLFYIFTISYELDPGDLNFSIVDMTLQGGDGDVTIKNSFLRTDLTEKLAAVYHCNNHDVWVMTHERNSNSFVAYLVTNAGISAPVVSSVGPVHTDVHGQLKFNNTGTKIAGTRDTLLQPWPTPQGIAAIDLFDFNNTTGIVSNPLPLTLNNHQMSYGVEFSPDNSKLYVTYHDVTGASGGTSALVQFNLNATNVDASKITIAGSLDQDISGLQVARDNKIYLSRINKPFVSVINDPNLAGAACNYVDNAINLDPGGNGIYGMLGLSGFVQSFFHPAFPNIPCSPIDANFFSSDTVLCSGQCINFTDTSTGPIITRTWTFNGATPASSNAINPVNICYSTAGTFNVRLVVSDGTITDTVINTITVVASPTINAGSNATIQSGGSVSLNATGTATGFSWTPSTGLSSTIISNPVASPSVTTTYTVTGTGANGCQAQDVITVFVADVPIPCGEVFIPTAFSPNGTGEQKNELECVVGDCIVNMHFAIYDRWGEKVFETTDQKICWDGKYNGELMNTASFVYYFTATLVSGEEVSKKGNISLIR